MTTAHWRRTGQRSDPAFIVERHTAISQGVTVWEHFLGHTIIFSGPSRHFDSSQIRGRYFNADCATHASHPGAIYQQDNARPHTFSQQCLQGYDVLPWSARSPDLSPIEHVWNALGRQLQPSRDTGELTAQIMAGSSTGVISDLIESMPRRICLYRWLYYLLIFNLLQAVTA
ncbi:uncharacterized protein TNCV_1478281 [Trichonephila clavipes]|nr:uncharacterized protein TNCV_1478281 [Trichonephila clavipes]